MDVFKSIKVIVGKFFITLFVFLLALPMVNISSISVFADVYKNMPTIKVGYFLMEGYHNISSDGFRSGYGYDYLQEIAKITGWRYQYVDCTWEEGQRKLQNGEIDLLTSAQKTEDREKNFDFSNLSMGTSHVLLTVKSNNDNYLRNQFDKFDGINVGFLGGNTRNEQFKDFAASKGFTFTTPESEYSTATELESALQNGDIDAIVTSSLRKIDNEKIIAKFFPSPYFAIVKKGDSLILDSLNTALEEIEIRNSEFKSNLYTKYYGNNDGSEIVLTEEESIFIDNLPPIRVAALANQQPLSYFEEDKYKGILSDVLNLIAEEISISFLYIPVNSHSEAISFYRENKIDIIPFFDSDYAWAEKNNLRITSPFTKLQYSSLMSKKNTTNKDIVVTTRDNYFNSAFIEKNYPSDKIKYKNTAAECINSVKNGEAGITFVNSYFANQLSALVKNNLTTAVVPDFYSNLSLAVDINADPLLYTILDKVVISLDENQISNIVVKHTVMPNTNLDFIEFIYQNPLLSISFIVILFLIIICVIAAVFFVKKNMHRRIYHLAYTDQLTGLWNKNRFEEEVVKILANSKPEEKFSLVAMDIKKFSNINDNYGRNIGDKVIIHVASTLSKLIDKGVYVARLKSDHFVLLLNTDNADIINDIINNLSVELYNTPKEGINFKLKFNFGIYIINDTDITINQLLEYAELARLETKKSFNNIIYFDSKLKERLKKDKEIESLMETALENKEFLVYYQPKYSLVTHDIIGAEALVRWNSPSQGFMNPIEFIPVFEKNGFIVELDFYVLEETCKILQDWIQKGIPLVPISVNQSRIHFQSKKYIERLCTLVEKYDIPFSLIELEITETAFIDSESTLSTVKKLKDIGFRLSMDDFGSEYSSLNLLNALHLNVLKIDKGFLSESEVSDRSKVIIQKVVEMAYELNMEVICEGVETTKQVDLLLLVGCQYAQGYLFSRPIPKDKFLELYLAFCNA